MNEFKIRFTKVNKFHYEYFESVCGVGYTLSIEANDKRGDWITQIKNHNGEYLVEGSKTSLKNSRAYLINAFNDIKAKNEV